jgi:hypothetical protein
VKLGDIFKPQIDHIMAATVPVSDPNPEGMA